VGYGILLSLSGYIGSTGFGATVAVFFLLGIFSGLTGPTNAALVGDLVEREENALAMTLFNFAGNAGIVAGPLIAGWVLDTWNAVYAFVAGGVIELAALVLAAPFLRLGRNRD
jgi:MFS family permease